MAREEVPLDQPTFDRVLAEELGKGTDRRVAEGRARSAAVRAYRKEHGEPERAARPAPAAATPAAGDGGGAPEAAAAAAPAAAPQGAVAASPVTAAVAAPARIAPPPTGRPPTPKPGAPAKHRLAALAAPDGVERGQRERGHRTDPRPHPSRRR